ncbi:hypothetical protein Vretimale_15730 [Volvox reticuliferus]|nr:hypothetical protein Vretifemale_18351 [Volvox reticuliferus]GIM12394.1 hypothetical protein Vretimale_15730 [Volvox reticuliferus]
MHVMKRYHHAAAVQPAAALEVLQDTTSPPATEAAFVAVADSAAGGSGGTMGGLIPLVSSAGLTGAGLANGGHPAGAAVSGLLAGAPLLSLGQGGSLGLSPEVARDMMRAAAVAASTTAATATGPATGGAGPAALVPPGGPLSIEDGQVAAVRLTGMDQAAGAGPQGSPVLASAEGSALTEAPRQHQCTQRQQHNASQQHVGGSGPAVQKPGGGGCHGASKVNLLKWLRRSNRWVQPKESFWIFCEVLLLLDSCQAAAGMRACGLRPSKLVLYSNGRVAFAPPSLPPSAAAAAMGVTGPVKGGGGDGGNLEGRRKRRRRSAGQLRCAVEEHRPPAATLDGGRCHVRQGQALQGAAAAVMASNTVANAVVSNGLSNAAEAAAVGVPLAMADSTAAAIAGPQTVTAARSQEDDEDALYRSPEEALGHPATQASDMFSLGLLFFELFYVCAGQERAALLRDARQRVLPPSFSRQQPKEAAFAMALLHPDPACRPTLAELLGSAMFRATCTSLRQKAQRPGAPAAAAPVGAAAANGREQPHQHQRRIDHNRKYSQADRGMAATAGPSAEGAKQQQRNPAHRLVNGSNDGMWRPAAAGTVDAQARDAVVAGAPGVITRSGGPTPAFRGHRRVDYAVLFEFLHMLRKRKLEELAKMDAELAFLTADAQMVEQYLLYLHQTRSAKRQRGGVGGAGAGAIASPPAAGGALVGDLASCGGAGEGIPTMLPPSQPQSTHAHLEQKAATGDMETAAVEAVLDEKGTGDVLAYSGGSEGARLTAASGGNSTTAARVRALPHSAAWSEQHQAAQSKWCRIAHKYEHFEPVFLERCRRPSAPAQAHQGSAEPLSSAAVARRHADAGGLPEPLLRFAEDLAAFATFTTLTPVASLQYGDPHTENAMVAGAAFDRDDEFFALAGVNKRIKIFEREAVLQSSIGTHYPVLEISSRSRLSSVTWSSYIKGHLASADYEGVVQLWDTHTNSELMQFEEHRRRVWSVDFSQADPARLLSGGDDGLVKLWSIQQDTSTSTIELNANVCSVQFSPTSPHIFAAGCANSHIFLYDIRNIANPLYVLAGHTRAVSYVRFLSPTQLVSASTDNTLRLWQLDRLGTSGSAPGSFDASASRPATADAIAASCTQIFRGHVNERNFTGLSLSPDGYITCGSENNRVVCYYQNLPMPVTSFDFAVPDPDAHASGGGGAAAAVACGTVGGGGEGGAGQSAGGGLRLAAGSGAGGVDCGGMGASKSGSRSGTGQFVSSVCWSRRSNLLLAANSVGMVKLLTLH